MNVITAQPAPQGISQANSINPTGDVKCQYCQREVRLIKEPKQEMAFFGGSLLTCAPVCIYTCKTSMNSGLKVMDPVGVCLKVKDSVGAGITNGGIIGVGTGIMAAALTGCLVDWFLSDRKCTHVQESPILNQPQANTSALSEEQPSFDQQPSEVASVRFIDDKENFRRRFIETIRDTH